MDVMGTEGNRPMNEVVIDQRQDAEHTSTLRGGRTRVLAKAPNWHFSFRVTFWRVRAFLVLVFGTAAAVNGQTVATLQGLVFDVSGAALPRASITISNPAIGFHTVVSTDAEGRYYVPAIPAGSYEVTAAADGFKPEIIQELTFEVGRTLVRDFELNLGGRSEAVIVTAELPLLDRATSTVGHVVSPQTIHEVPLNGRHFVDLGPLVPGSVAPSQTGFSSTPLRGTGALAFNTSGNREEAVGYIVNGVTTNNLTFGSIGFPPPVASVEEFKIDNSTFSPEYGHVSGAIVNIITRSGTDRFRGDAHEFVRDGSLDAKNFFEFTSRRPHRFDRNQFGGTLGGPVIRARTFFFATYEGLRQRQGLDLNGVVPSDAQRAAVTDPAIAQLIPLIPRANYFDADGTPRFVGSDAAFVDENTWTVDLRHNAGTRDRIQVFMGRQQIQMAEPTSLGTSIPGFGVKRHIWKSTVTVNETHSFGDGLLNEARFGQTAQDGSSLPSASLNPVDFGIGNGVDRPIGLPQMIVAGSLNFGGPAILPQGRKDTLYVFNDTVTHVVSRHSVRFGGEYRRFLNNNFAEGTGQFNFPSMDAFLAGMANAFSITLGRRSSRITQDAVSFFAQDNVRIGSALTLDLGLRYEWHVTPTERDNQFVVFDAVHRVAGPRGRRRQEDLSAEQPEFRTASRRGMDTVDGRSHCDSRRVRIGRRSAEHHGRARHAGQPAVCDAVERRLVRFLCAAPSARRSRSALRRSPSIPLFTTHRCDRGTSTCSDNSPGIWLRRWATSDRVVRTSGSRATSTSR